MRFKKIREMILNDDIDLHDRLFVLMVTVMIASWIVTLVEIIIFGGTLTDILVLAGGIVLFASVSMISIRLGRVRLGAILSALGVTILYLPLTFFFGGGIYGDAPLWFLFAMFFINMSLDGRAKIVFFILNGVVATACWVISYEFPETIVQNDRTMSHFFSFVALVLISVSMGIMGSFRNWLYNREVKRSI